MSEQVVLITGALTGIGRATAIVFAREGAKIVVSGRHDKAGQKLVMELRNLGAEAEFVRADVRQERDIQKLVDYALSRFGRLDVAVNNAGTEGQPGPFKDQTAETYAATSIVNISSTYGRAGASGAALYVASKHAVEGFTKAAALEFADTGIRINVVAPGPIETGMLNRFTGTPENKAELISRVPMKRIGQPEEVAEAILFLASDKASFITGASLAADGGKLAR